MLRETLLALKHWAWRDGWCSSQFDLAVCCVIAAVWLLLVIREKLSHEL